MTEKLSTKKVITKSFVIILPAYIIFMYEALRTIIHPIIVLILINAFWVFILYKNFDFTGDEE